MQILPCNSLSTFLSAVEKFRKDWKTDDEDLWFRGERREYGPSRLMPKLYRGLTATRKGTIGQLLELEVELFGDFARCAGPLCQRLPEDEWEWYFLMQHYSGPTRLLDWSDGALMALHFAIRDYPKASGDAVIYVLDSGWLADQLDDRTGNYDSVERKWKKFCKNRPQKDAEEWVETYLPQDGNDRDEIPLPKAPLIWDPSHVTARFAAQRSHFMIFGSDPKWLVNLANRRRSKLRAILIEHSCVAETKRELRAAGVTESVIFPDLDGLGRELSQRWDDYGEK